MWTCIEWNTLPQLCQQPPSTEAWWRQAYTLPPNPSAFPSPQMNFLVFFGNLQVERCLRIPPPVRKTRPVAFCVLYPNTATGCACLLFLGSGRSICSATLLMGQWRRREPSSPRHIWWKFTSPSLTLLLSLSLSPFPLSLPLSLCIPLSLPLSPSLSPSPFLSLSPSLPFSLPLSLSPSLSLYSALSFRSCLSSRDPYCIWLKMGMCATVAPGNK